MSTGNDPILVLQMQRMGDLVLSFPLLGWLARRFPTHPVWVVGEPAFFNPLLPLSPQVTYFSYDSAPNLGHLRFHAVLNLSHGPQAAALASKANTDTLIGPYLHDSGALYIRGDWQLYRASLTHNNRYNLFHWADLNALDIIPTSLMLRTEWPMPRPMPQVKPQPASQPMAQSVSEVQPEAFSTEIAPNSLLRASPLPSGARIGLFLGASETEKHPDADFWVALTRRLLVAGHKPVLLGGAAEKKLGFTVAAALKAHPLNLCGHFSVNSLARFIAELHLFITPDTGPMHIAAWTGTPTLNLSLGPVNPWETGPFSPGHTILRASIPCSGCWRCTQQQTICKTQMSPRRVAGIAEAIIANDRQTLTNPMPQLELFQSARGQYGLYSLIPMSSDESQNSPTALTNTNHSLALEELPSARLSLARFWQAWFGLCFGRFTEEDATRAWQNFSTHHPQFVPEFRSALTTLTRKNAQSLKKNPHLLLQDNLFWQQLPPLIRPLSGYLHMYAQNAEGSRSALLHVLSLLEKLTALVAS